jgi:ubiquinone/menaquinone biosynthesis C-methylase UbiE
VAGSQSDLAPERIIEANRLYHDQAAASYDAKWGISFDRLAHDQVLAKVRRAVGGPLPRLGNTLEIGSGTGYFSLNLLRAGVVGRLTCTDLSEGMLAALRRNAEALDCDVETVPCSAESLPFPDGSFDAVIGHAVLHHLPHLETAFDELFRVLRPGGVILFAGEPSLIGDRLATVPKRVGTALAPLWRRLVGARPRTQAGGGKGASPESLEPLVDVHAFTPNQLENLAIATGFTAVRVVGEELLANWFGWANRTVEATADPATIPWLWRQYAYRGYLLLQGLDRAVLEPALPPFLFYNLTLHARKPSA